MHICSPTGAFRAWCLAALIAVSGWNISARGETLDRVIEGWVKNYQPIDKFSYVAHGTIQKHGSDKVLGKGQVTFLQDGSKYRYDVLTNNVGGFENDQVTSFDGSTKFWLCRTTGRLALQECQIHDPAEDVDDLSPFANDFLAMFFPLIRFPEQRITILKLRYFQNEEQVRKMLEPFKPKIEASKDDPEVWLTMTLSFPTDAFVRNMCDQIVLTLDKKKNYLPIQTELILRGKTVYRVAPTLAETQLNGSRVYYVTKVMHDQSDSDGQRYVSHTVLENLKLNWEVTLAEDAFTIDLSAAKTIYDRKSDTFISVPQ
jgi:hypothetical protein